MIERVSVPTTHQASFLAHMGVESDLYSDDRLYLESKPLVFPDRLESSVLPGSGLRQAMINALLLGVGSSAFTATMAVELINRVAVEAGVPREKQRMVDDPDAHFMNTVLRACGSVFEGQGFERVSGDTWIIDARGRINRGNNYIINGQESAEQLARSIAFTKFTKRLPVEWFEISELASGNGHMVEDLVELRRQLTGADGSELMPVGDFARAELGTLHTSHARADYIQKLEGEGLIDIKYDPLARIRPEVKAQVDLLEARRADLESGRLHLCGFETGKVQQILSAYNRIQDKSNGDALLMQIPQEIREELGIRKADVNDVLSKIRVTRAKGRFSGADLMPEEVFPIPQSWTLLYYTRPDFVRGEISEELKWLTDLNQRYGQQWFPVQAGRFPGTSSAYYQNKNLLVDKESRALCIGFKSEAQRRFFGQVLGALDYYSQEYSRLLNTSEGRAELIAMFESGLELNPGGNSVIGFNTLRESLLKDAVNYLLNLMARKAKK